ncbi:cobalt-precorrin-5B (C(1))-methyltransferase [Baaleninema simplex]|nr:cobalt-precorrin-5B (C(1))-methyltransferase [Baaleninema simplex]
MARSGYTLPVFAVAAAKAALTHLLEQPLVVMRSNAIWILQSFRGKDFG